VDKNSIDTSDTRSLCDRQDGPLVKSACKTNKKAPQGADGHRRQHTRLVAVYLQSQSQASSLGQRGDKTPWILVIPAFRKLQSHVTVPTGGEIQKSGFKKL